MILFQFIGLSALPTISPGAVVRSGTRFSAFDRFAIFSDLDRSVRLSYQSCHSRPAHPFCRMVPLTVTTSTMSHLYGDVCSLPKPSRVSHFVMLPKCSM